MMAKRESVQKKLQRIRPPRVQLTYDVEVGDIVRVKVIQSDIYDLYAELV